MLPVLGGIFVSTAVSGVGSYLYLCWRGERKEVPQSEIPESEKQEELEKENRRKSGNTALHRNDTWCRLPFSGIKRAVRLGGSKYLNSSFLHCLFIVTGSIVISREEQILAKLLQFDLEAFPILNSRKHGKSF